MQPDLKGEFYLYAGPPSTKLAGWIALPEVVRDRKRHWWYQQAIALFHLLSEILQGAGLEAPDWELGLRPGFSDTSFGPWIVPLPMWGDQQFAVAWRCRDEDGQRMVVIASPIPLPWLEPDTQEEVA